MNFEAIIGLELHVQMKTNSKLFSSAPVSFGKEPNTNVAPFDMAFSGTMPVLNKQAVINAIRVCHALNMTIDNELWFDRKNYFYSDLPKGYQITQQKRPIGKEGFLQIQTSSGFRKIGIERLHIEEDTCKQVHYKDYTLLDYNRAGIPLVEIVSKPEIKNGEEAMKYVEKIRSIVSYLGVSDGKMEEGSLRCDVNVSIRPIGSNHFGTKVEIKNLNTLANIQKAIDYEIKRQESLLLCGETVSQETRRFDERLKQTVLMRLKTDEVDYKCFTDPNILPITLSKAFIDEAISTAPKLPEEKSFKYKEMGLSESECQLLASDKGISEYFDEVIKEGADSKLAANWVLVDVRTILNKNKSSIVDFPISPNNFAKLIKLIEKGIVYNKQARNLFLEMLTDNKDPELLVKDIVVDQLKESELTITINMVLDENPQSINDYKNGKDKVIGYLVAQVLKKTKGKGNPSLINELILKELKVR